MYKSLPHSTGEWVMRATEAWCFKRSGEATGEDVASVAVDNPAHWRCQEAGMTTKDSDGYAVELA